MNKYTLKKYADLHSELRNGLTVGGLTGAAIGGISGAIIGKNDRLKNGLKAALIGGLTGSLIGTSPMVNPQINKRLSNSMYTRGK